MSYVWNVVRESFKNLAVLFFQRGVIFNISKTCFLSFFLNQAKVLGSYCSGFADRLYPSIIEKKLGFLKRSSKDFFEILDLSSPNTRGKYFFKRQKYWTFFFQATAVDT